MILNGQCDRYYQQINILEEQMMKTITILTNNINMNIDELGKISPFATREDEEINRFVVERPCGITLQPIDYEIVKLIGKYLILSSKLIGTLLTEYDADTIKTHMRKLTHSNFIYMAEFCNNHGGRSSAKFYALSTRGRGLLYNLGEHVRMTQYVAGLTSCDAKKLLSAIQYCVNRSIVTTATDFDTQTAPIVLVNPKDGERSPLMFRPQMVIYNEGKAVEFIESVRQATKPEELIEKLDRMVITLSKKNLNVSVADNYKTVLICEDYDHMLSTMAYTNQKKYKSLNLVYTYDLATFNSPSDCLYEYTPKKPSGFFSNLISAFF